MFVFYNNDNNTKCYESRLIASQWVFVPSPFILHRQTRKGSAIQTEETNNISFTRSQFLFPFLYWVWSVCSVCCELWAAIWINVFGNVCAITFNNNNVCIGSFELHILKMSLPVKLYLKSLRKFIKLFIYDVLSMNIAGAH